MALPESLFGKHYVHEALHKLTGYYHPVAYEKRMGLTRAYSFFDHPIHYGTFCASLFALMWYSERGGYSKFSKAGLVLGSTFLGLSSAPLLCIGVQGGLVGWDRLTKRIKGRAGITTAIVLIGYTVLALMATRNPFTILATGLTLDPWTGYYRVMIWTYGMDTVAQYPIFGIGLGDWVRPDWMFSSTVDAFWLVIAMTTGVPALLFLVGALFLLARNVHKPRFRPLDIQTKQLRLAWTFALFALSLAGFTVHYWNAIHGYFFFICGIAGWMADDMLIKRAAYQMQQKMGMARNGRKALAERDDEAEKTHRPSTGPYPAPGTSLWPPNASDTRGPCGTCGTETGICISSKFELSFYRIMVGAGIIFDALVVI